MTRYTSQTFVYTVGGDFDVAPILKMTPAASAFNLQCEGDGVDGTYTLKIKNRNFDSISYVTIKEKELTEDEAYKVHNQITLYGDMIVEITDGTATVGKVLVTINYD